MACLASCIYYFLSLIQKTEYSQPVPNLTPNVTHQNPVETFLLGSKALVLNHSPLMLDSLNYWRPRMGRGPFGLAGVTQKKPGVRLAWGALYTYLPLPMSPLSTFPFQKPPSQPGGPLKLRRVSPWHFCSLDPHPLLLGKGWRGHSPLEAPSWKRAAGGMALGWGGVGRENWKPCLQAPASLFVWPRFPE